MPDFCLYLFGQKAAEDLWQRLPETLVLTGSLLPRYVLLCTFYSLNIVLTGSLLPSSSLADSWWPLYSPNFAFWASWTQQVEGTMHADVKTWRESSSFSLMKSPCAILQHYLKVQ